MLGRSCSFLLFPDTRQKLFMLCWEIWLVTWQSIKIFAGQRKTNVRFGATNPRCTEGVTVRQADKCSGSGFTTDLQQVYDRSSIPSLQSERVFFPVLFWSTLCSTLIMTTLAFFPAVRGSNKCRGLLAFCCSCFVLGECDQSCLGKNPRRGKYRKRQHVQHAIPNM